MLGYTKLLGNGWHWEKIRYRHPHYSSMRTKKQWKGKTSAGRTAHRNVVKYTTNKKFMNCWIERIAQRAEISSTMSDIQDLSSAFQSSIFVMFHEGQTVQHMFMLNRLRQIGLGAFGSTRHRSFYVLVLLITGMMFIVNI